MFGGNTVFSVTGLSIHHFYSVNGVKVKSGFVFTHIHLSCKTVVTSRDHWGRCKPDLRTVSQLKNWFVPQSAATAYIWNAFVMPSAGSAHCLQCFLLVEEADLQHNRTENKTIESRSVKLCFWIITALKSRIPLLQNTHFYICTSLNEHPAE